MGTRLLWDFVSAIGAVVGGVLGYLGFFWFLGYGFYALVLPGALIGVGCMLVSRTRSYFRGLMCGAAAVGLGFFTEWRAFPFKADQSLAYFLAHLQDLKPVTLVLVAVGALVAFWCGKDYVFGFRTEVRPVATEK